MRLAWFGTWAVAFYATALAYAFLGRGDNLLALLAAAVAFGLLARCILVAIRA